LFIGQSDAVGFSSRVTTSQLTTLHNPVFNYTPNPDFLSIHQTIIRLIGRQPVEPIFQTLQEQARWAPMKKPSQKRFSRKNTFSKFIPSVNREKH
jgi:hypothetical protein